MRNILFIFIFVILTSCATTHNSTNISQWQGRSADLLLQQQGSPKAIIPATNGNTLFIYTVESQEPNPIVTSNPTTIVGPKGNTVAANIPQPANQTVNVLRCTMTYEVNKQHMIVSVKAEGTRC